MKTAYHVEFLVHIRLQDQGLSRITHSNGRILFYLSQIFWYSSDKQPVLNQGAWNWLKNPLKYVMGIGQTGEGKFLLLHLCIRDDVCRKKTGREPPMGLFIIVIIVFRTRMHVQH